MSIDPKTLTPAELAFVDAMFPREEMDFLTALNRAEPWIRGRREALAESMPGEDRRAQEGAGKVSDTLKLQAAPVAKHEVCPNCLKLTEVGHASSNCDSGFVCGKPAPAASELPEAVQRAITCLREADTGIVHALGVEKRAADALEAWARSLPTASAGLPKVRALVDRARQAARHLCPSFPEWSELLLRDSDAALAELDAAQAVGMTPGLELVLDGAQHDAEYSKFIGQSASANKMSLAISAVRAQAAKAQAVPGQVEVIPIGLWQLEELLKYADLAEVALRTGFHPPDFLFEPADCSLRNCIDAVKEQRDRYLAAVEGGR